MDDQVRAAFDEFDSNVRSTLLEARELVLQTAAELEVGPLTETLKWGEPAYLTEASRSGTTLRLATPKNRPDHCAIFVHCQTTLVTEFREVIDHPAIGFDGNRAVIFPADLPLPVDALRHCIAQALTYKRR